MIFKALDEFARRLSQHLPASEAGLREVLAQAIRETGAYGPGEVEVEARLGRKRVDVWVHPTMSALELKYHRGIPSGRNRPMTADYGQILADIRKLATAESARERVMIVITDPPGLTHMTKKGLLPLRLLDPKAVDAPAVSALAASAKDRALSEGPWIPVTVRRSWYHQFTGVSVSAGIAWSVEIATEGHENR